MRRVRLTPPNPSRTLSSPAIENDKLEPNYLHLSDWQSACITFERRSYPAFLKETAFVEKKIEKAIEITEQFNQDRQDKNKEPLPLFGEEKSYSVEQVKKLDAEKKGFLARFFKGSLDDSDYTPTLTPKGLAVLSHLYGLKDNSIYQPLIADSHASLYHLMEQMVNTEVGTEVDLIFTDIQHDAKTEEPRDPISHYACKIIKTKIGLQFIHTRSKGNSSTFFNPILDDFFQKHAEPLSIESICFYDNTQIRQMTGYTDEAFAAKDARLLKTFIPPQIKVPENILENRVYLCENILPLPPAFMKSTQNLTLLNLYLEKNRKTVQEKVNRKGQTLQEVATSHRASLEDTSDTEMMDDSMCVNNYAVHFTEKHIAWVLSFLADILIKKEKRPSGIPESGYSMFNDPFPQALAAQITDEPQEPAYEKKLKDIVNQFDASQITSEELERRYQSKPNQQRQDETQSNVRRSSTPH